MCFIIQSITITDAPVIHVLIHSNRYKCFVTLSSFVVLAISLIMLLRGLYTRETAAATIIGLSPMNLSDV